MTRRRFVVFNAKGGSAKTTTAVSLGAEAADRGLRTLLVDCDPQGASATMWLPPQWDGGRQQADLADVLMHGAPLEAATWPTGVPGLDIVPSFQSARQFELVREPGVDQALRIALEDGPPYDVTVIDCPPNAGTLTVNGLAAAGEVIIPVRAGGLDLAGVSDLNQTLALVKRRLNPQVRVVAVVVCAVLRSRFTDAVVEQLAQDYPGAIHHQVRHTVRVEEAPTVHQPLRDYAPKATATADYAALAARLLNGAA